MSTLFSWKQNLTIIWFGCFNLRVRWCHSLVAIFMNKTVSLSAICCHRTTMNWAHPSWWHLVICCSLAKMAMMLSWKWAWRVCDTKRCNNVLRKKHASASFHDSINKHWFEWKSSLFSFSSVVLPPREETTESIIRVRMTSLQTTQPTLVPFYGPRNVVRVEHRGLWVGSDPCT